MIGPIKRKQMLRLLFWESTIKCNLNCAHCRRIESDETAFRDMSTHQAKDLIEQIAELGERQSMMPVLVFSGGEPLCRQDIFELVSISNMYGIRSALATNGTLISSTIAEQIYKSGIMRVSVSLDGATAEVHDSLRQLKGSFEMAVEGIKQLRERQIPFQINMTMTKRNAHQLEDICALAKKLGAVEIHIFMLVPVGCGVSLADTEMLTPEQYEHKMLQIYKLNTHSKVHLKVTCGPHYERIKRQEDKISCPKQDNMNMQHSSKGCLAGLGVLFVGHHGDVFPCGYLPVKCGNVLEGKLLDFWFNSPELARMRNINKLEGKCGLCEYRQVCGGCRGRAYSATGNYMAPEPYCKYIPSGVNV